MFNKKLQNYLMKLNLVMMAGAFTLATSSILNLGHANTHQTIEDNSTTLYIVRHGETDWNAKGLIQGNTNNPLNDKGLGQAKAVAAQLGTVEIDMIYPSELTRAIQTAEAISQGVKAPVKPDNRLNERSRGMYEGREQSAVKAEFARRFASLDDDMNGGESLRSINTRVGDFTRELIKKHQGETIMVVGHSGVNPLVIGALINLPPERAIAEIKQGNDEVYKLQVSADGTVQIWKLIPNTKLNEL